jgi:hypothetical protein
LLTVPENYDTLGVYLGSALRISVKLQTEIHDGQSSKAYSFRWSLFAINRAALVVILACVSDTLLLHSEMGRGRSCQAYVGKIAMFRTEASCDSHLIFSSEVVGIIRWYYLTSQKDCSCYASVLLSSKKGFRTKLARVWGANITFWVHSSEKTGMVLIIHDDDFIQRWCWYTNTNTTEDELNEKMMSIRIW